MNQPINQSINQSINLQSIVNEKNNFLFLQESVGVAEIVTYYMIGMVSAKVDVLTSVTNRVLNKVTSVREKTLPTTSTD